MLSAVKYSSAHLLQWESFFKYLDRKGVQQNLTDTKRCKFNNAFRKLSMQGIQDFHRKYVLVPADKAANNVVVV